MALDIEEIEDINAWTKQRMKKTAWAYIYVNKKFFLVETWSGYAMVQKDYQGKELFLEPGASDTTIGEAVLDVLTYSRYITRTPRDSRIWVDPEAIIEEDWSNWGERDSRYDQWVEQVQARFGYKTKSALFKGMLSCNVIKREGQLTISPKRRERGGGFTADDYTKQGEVSIPEDSSAEAIGAAIRAALEYAS